MWFLLLAGGAVVVQLAGVPASRRLPVAPPPELLLVAWFLFAAAVRLGVMRVRLAAYERKARRLARRNSDKGFSPMGELGLGVGRGALQAVGGDVVGASLSLMAALLRGAAGSLKASPPPVKERRRGSFKERVTAMTCVLGVGLVCAGLSWWPLVGARATRAALPLLREVGLAPEPPKPGVDGLRRRDNIGPPGVAPSVTPPSIGPPPAEPPPTEPQPTASPTAAPTQGETP